MPFDGKKLKAFAQDDGGPLPPKKGKGGPPPGKEGPPQEKKGKGGQSDEDIVAQVVKDREDGKLDDEAESLAAGYDPEQDGNPPSWVADADIWQRAKEAVDPEGKGADFDSPWAVVATVYKRMGGSISGGGEGEE